MSTHNGQGDRGQGLPRPNKVAVAVAVAGGVINRTRIRLFTEVALWVVGLFSRVGRGAEREES